MDSKSHHYGTIILIVALAVAASLVVLLKNSRETAIIDSPAFTPTPSSTVEPVPFYPDTEGKG